MENRPEIQPDPNEVKFTTFARKIRRITRASGRDAAIIASSADATTHLELSTNGDWTVTMPEEDIADNYGKAPLEDVIHLFADVTDPEYGRIELEDLERRVFPEGRNAYMRQHRERFVSGLLGAMEQRLSKD